ncbi:MAG TPA: hypothetical protein VGL81_20410 [Polyangiaceae bacterium]|jgi:hypothetical protein
MKPTKGVVLAFLGLVTACDSSGTIALAPDASADGPVLDATADGVVAEAGPDPCADAGLPPTSLACTGLYADLGTKQLAANAVAYTPATPLWSDNAQKARWIELPPGTTIDISNPDEWMFPVGTKLFKEFRIDSKRVETRMFQKSTPTFWVFATYAWNGDDSAATISYGGPVPVGDGGTWNIPSNDDCSDCHKGRQDRILGFEQVGLGLPGAQGLTLAELAAQGLVTPLPASTTLTVGDDGTGLDGLALGWIHVNCGVTCHNSNPAAAGFGAGMLLRLHAAQLDGTPPSAAWDVFKTTVNVPCTSGSVAGEPRIVPGDPADSVVYQLMDERGTLQMPPIGSVLVDVPDVAVVHAWIQAMGAAGDGGADTDASGPFDAGDDGSHHHDGGGEHDAGPADGMSDDDAGD